MARAGASKSLDKPVPKARGTSKAAAPAPVKGASKTTAKAASKAAGKKADPPAVAKRPTAKTAAEAAKAATKAAKPAASKPVSKAPARQVKAAKTAKPTPTAVKAREPHLPSPRQKASAKAVKATKAKAAPAARTAQTRRNSEAQVAEAKGKRTATATKAPAGTVPAAAPAEASSSFPAKTLEKLRRLLEDERETYLRQAHDLAAEAEALAAEREPGDTQFDEESGEGDTLNVERERDLALSASALQAVEDIDAALHRMEVGTYGICERCGKKISVARLEALPFAALCIECKSREERRR